MFQCLGLGTAESGGCGEDWYHPGCLVGMGPRWFEKMKTNLTQTPSKDDNGALPTISEGSGVEKDSEQSNAVDLAVIEEDDPPMPPGFPEEDDFEGLICYKCVKAHPWVRDYAGTPGFLEAVKLHHNDPAMAREEPQSKKRKPDDSGDDDVVEAKRIKSEDGTKAETNENTKQVRVIAQGLPAEGLPSDCKRINLPTAPKESFSLFFKEDFREKFCHCSFCYKHLDKHPQLLEEEEVYEPPLSEDGASQHGGSTNGSGSLLERGESALRNVDRVRAIEGVMAYNHLKEQLKPFFQQFAASGEAIGAEDIKAYFAKLRGDDESIQQAGQAAASSKDDDDDGKGDIRRERSGY